MTNNFDSSCLPSTIGAMSPHIIYDSESDETPKATAVAATATSVAASPITNTIIAASKRRGDSHMRSLHDHLGGGKGKMYAPFVFLHNLK